MLEELRVENLLLMERAELRLGAGLNVLTGETGAGKTLLAHALDLLLGGRARKGIVRPGAAEAYVEGVFGVPASLAGSEALPTGAHEVVLARRVWPDGRTRAYLCGRAATQADLRELGAELLSFYGQHEHRRLMLSTAQLDVLDAFCGPEQSAARARAAEAHQGVRALERRAVELGALGGERDRELDLLRFELGEIESVGPSPEEARALAGEQTRLLHLERLRAAAQEGTEAITPEAGLGAAELISRAAARLADAAELDPGLSALAERLESLRYEAEDVGGELRRYGLELEAGESGGPGRLDEVEARLEAFARLERKHGGSIESVLDHAEHCRRRCRELESADEDREAALRELTGARERLEALAGELHRRRARAAPRLAAAVRERLGELAMAEARFEVELIPREEGSGPRGSDTVELRLSANPGTPVAPLREIASGGELSRVMLALLSVAHGDGVEEGGAAGESGVAGDGEPLLVFDEIDAGIGGHTARAVGRHLRELAQGRQILCITHLPQVAALADRHFTIAKDTSLDPARTTVSALDADDDLVGELVRMLGAGDGDVAASRHARELLRAA